ncbi:MAG TPA: hypothetical protein VFU22_26770 [Roseiflexaceae bacterium]|nr:hypothetical protein [Roseiflexaceae bacterium]
MITRERTETLSPDRHHRSHRLLVRLRRFVAAFAYPIGGEMVAGTSDGDRLGVPPAEWAGLATMRLTDGPACIHAFQAMYRRWAAQQPEREVRR